MTYRNSTYNAMLREQRSRAPLGRRATIVPGTRFGQLIIMERQGYRVRVACDCGNVIECTIPALRAGKKDCGCVRAREAQDRVQSNLLRHIWLGIKTRCANEKGIALCDRWQSFENFSNDVDERPSTKHVFDRIDLNGAYEPDNCKWMTLAEQAKNRMKGK